MDDRFARMMDEIKAEDRGRRTEDGGQTTEDGGQMDEGRTLK
jgi:hypothetical protein